VGISDIILSLVSPNLVSSAAQTQLLLIILWCVSVGMMPMLSWLQNQY
jgi:hypothetical protein